jgi:NAD(P)-dependent dehydrogenase (short-subunit alcohol dehydrogenase family)
MDLGLKDRVAIVAASSKGLGKAVALGLAAEGARLALCARGEEELRRTASEIPGEVIAEVLDVTVESQVSGFAQNVLQKFGRIDICVTNAGGPPAKKFDDTSIEEWRSAVDLNFMSTVYLGQTDRDFVSSRIAARGWLNSFECGALGCPWLGQESVERIRAVQRTGKQCLPRLHGN